MPRPTDTADRLRHEIDSGRTGDKVDAPDPAAAPLGTDDEASGHPVTREQAALARRRELGRGAPAPDTPGAGGPRRIPGEHRGVRMPEGRILALMLAALAALALVLWAWLGG